MVLRRQYAGVHVLDGEGEVLEIIPMKRIAHGKWPLGTVDPDILYSHDLWQRGIGGPVPIGSSQ